MSRRLACAFCLLALGVLAACRDAAVPTQAPTAVIPTLPAVAGVTGPAQDGGSEQPAADPALQEPTPIPPTPTPTEPLAALVNDQPILLADYEKELARYEQALIELGQAPGANGQNYRSVVLEALIETELIAQAAAANGLVVTDEMVEERLAELREASGGADNFAAWLEANQWTEAEFRLTLASEMLTELVVDFVTQDVPEAAEQVRARYIQVDDLALAQSLLEQIRNGADFAALAQQYSLDRATAESGGDLGFFARGSLLVPEVEAAAFTLGPDQVSEIITAAGPGGTGTAYYIVQFIERDPQRLLDANMRLNLLQARFEAWLADLWSQANVVRYVNTGA